jgi:ribosomal protein S18 acetylase RimI-like enzyme
VIAIRGAIPADATAVSALLAQLGYAVSPAAATNRLRFLGSTGADPIFVACEDAICLGLLSLHIAPMLQHAKPAARITALVVDERHRRRGVGRRLIAHAVTTAAATGCELVELTSALDRTEAHSFYRSLGFEANSLRFRLTPR